MSVIFSAVLMGIGSVAAAAVTAIERVLPVSLEFEVSQDGEKLWQADRVYDFVGFGEGGKFSPAIDSKERPVLGRRLGTAGADSSPVREIETITGEYVMVCTAGTHGEIYKLRED